MQGDASLVSDIVVVVCATAFGGLIAARLGQPLLLGFLISGMAAGPYGASLINEVIQTEALAQLGVALILFSLGVELDLTRIAHVR
jgi:CPA2 family monovalent cation:H+ antiporter-2